MKKIKLLKDIGSRLAGTVHQALEVSESPEGIFCFDGRGEMFLALVGEYEEEEE